MWQEGRNDGAAWELGCCDEPPDCSSGRGVLAEGPRAAGVYVSGGSVVEVNGQRLVEDEVRDWLAVGRIEDGRLIEKSCGVPAYVE